MVRKEASLGFANIMTQKPGGLLTMSIPFSRLNGGLNGGLLP